MKSLLLKLIRAYQAVSRTGVATPFALGGYSGCRSWPTCSEYAYEAISEGGLVRGGIRAVRRVLSCHSLPLKRHIHA